LEDDKIQSPDAIINYMHRDEAGKTIVREIQIDDEAEFDQFPPGFIDQEQRDTAELIRLLKNKRNAAESTS
jgi:predicted ATPase